MINQNQLQSSEKMVDLFETEELESRLEMCGGWNESPCDTGDGGGSVSCIPPSETVGPPHQGCVQAQ